MSTASHLKDFPEGTVNFSARKRSILKAVKKTDGRAAQSKLWAEIFSELLIYIDPNADFDLNKLRKKFQRKYYLKQI